MENRGGGRKGFLLRLRPALLKRTTSAAIDKHPGIEFHFLSPVPLREGEKKNPLKKGRRKWHIWFCDSQYVGTEKIEGTARDSKSSA